MDIHAGRGVAVREYPLKRKGGEEVKSGFADWSSRTPRNQNSCPSCLPPISPTYPEIARILFIVHDPDRRIPNDRRFARDFESRGRYSILVVR